MEEHIFDRITTWFVIFIFGIAFGYVWRMMQEDKPIQDVTLSSIQDSIQDGHTAYLPYEGKLLKVIPRRDGGITIKFEEDTRRVRR